MSTLSCLPTEVIIRLLSFLPLKDLASCARLSKQFLNIIRSSSILTYALELGKAGLEETFSLSFDRFENSECNPSELLAELLRGKEYTNIEVCGSVFTGGYTRFTEERGVNTIDIFDFRNIKNNEPVTTLSFDAMYSGYAIDAAGQDLLVLVGKCVPTEYVAYLRTGPSASCLPNVHVLSLFCKLHLRSLSTGLEYKHTETICSGIRAFLCTMISETELLLVGCGENNVPLLKYCTINDFNSNSSTADENESPLQYPPKCLNEVIFHLPFKYHSGSDILKTWEAELILEEASYTPKPFSPFLKTSNFVYHPNPQIIGIKFQNNDVMSFMGDIDNQTHLSHAFDMFIHLNSLRKLKNKFSLNDSRTLLSDNTFQVPWEKWGPAITRVLTSEYNSGEWNPNRCIRGYRVLTYDSRLWNGGLILDFNINGWQSSMQGIIRDQSELLSCDGIKITSSLPYREIRMPSLQTESELQSAGPCSILMGDDIVYMEGDLPNTRLHVFRF
ncbi:hypothetical protein Clacol_002085 [Clathrus columnatus]|uniref:F-box domain-containing protein n=1 Tax=Clathrus columnatus TaxID=1419009 RepID=A0AAV5A3P4_9AGAM|nr:hypothetical protein Clacol_002085 [Clathrus columnatus]